MSEFVAVIASGILGSAVMAIFLSIVHRSQLANGDMIRALGSAFTKSERNSLLPGLGIHLIAGVFFAFLYAVVVSMAPVQSLFGYLAVCTGFGFFHGLVMSMVLTIAVAEHHPLERFRKAGPDVVITHLAAHVLYGAVVGVSLALFGFTKFIDL